MVEHMVLKDISIHVKDMCRDIRNYGLPELDALSKLINIKILKNLFLVHKNVFRYDTKYYLKINAFYSSV